MGFWDFLKKIKEEEKEEVIEEISLDKLGGWIDARLKEKAGGLDLKLGRIKEKIERERKAAEESVVNLIAAELKNKDVPERLVQIMEGNRKIYEHRMGSFLSRVKFPSESGEILSFCNDFDKNLEEFEKSIGKNHHVMGEFFPAETGTISRSVKNIDGFVKEVRKIVKNSGIEKTNKLKRKINEMKSADERKKKIEEKIKSAEEEFKNKNEEIDNEKNKSKLIESGEEFGRFKEFINEKDGLVSELGAEKARLVGSFSAIETALKKYVKINEDDKLAVKYLEEPLKNLEQDSEFKIVGILKKIGNLVGSGGLELKDKKRDKVLAELKKLDREFFEGFLRNCEELNVKLKEVEEKISEFEVQGEIDALKKNLEIGHRELEGCRGKIEKLRAEVGKIDVDVLREELKRMVGEIGVRVV